MTGIVRLLAVVTLFGSVLGPVLAAPACFTPPEQIGLYVGVLASSVLIAMLALTCALVADIAEKVLGIVPFQLPEYVVDEPPVAASDAPVVPPIPAPPYRSQRTLGRPILDEEVGTPEWIQKFGKK